MFRVHQTTRVLSGTATLPASVCNVTISVFSCRRTAATSVFKPFSRESHITRGTRHQFVRRIENAYLNAAKELFDLGGNLRRVCVHFARSLTNFGRSSRSSSQIMRRCRYASEPANLAGACVKATLLSSGHDAISGRTSLYAVVPLTLRVIRLESKHGTVAFCNIVVTW